MSGMMSERFEQCGCLAAMFTRHFLKWETCEVLPGLT